MLHLRYCATTPVGLWSPLDERRGARQVVRRADPRRILFPETQAVRAHIAAVLDPAAQLGAMLVYGCGLRASEVVNLPENPFAEGGSGSLRYLKVLGKGAKTRLVEIEPFLVRKIEFYKDFERLISAASVSGTRPERLLLRTDGSPFDYRSFYRAFRKAGPISPHLGRHWYAVNFLLQARCDRGLDEAIGAEMLRLHLDVELIRLQQNLGHSSLSTTSGYLVALNQALRPIRLQEAWEGLLDG